VFWTTSHEDAEAIWALLPQEKTPEFLAEQSQYTEYQQTMEELGRRAPVSPTLIGLNLAMFVVLLSAGADFVRPSSDVLIRLGSNFGPFTWGGQEWRLLTAAFLHAGIVHIVLNMFALYQGGALVERLYGSGRFLLIYLLAALAGSVASTWYDPLRNSVGASGAIFGVYGALLVFFALRRADFPPSLWKGIGTSALLFCGYSLALGAAHPLIDNTAHIGGLLGGALAGLILVRPLNVEARRRPQPSRLVMAAVAVLAPLAWLAAPLINGSQGDELRFRRELETFLEPDAAYSAKMRDLLTPAENVRMNRIEVAERLRSEVLMPWREAARPLLEGATLADGSNYSREQKAMRDYLRAKEELLSLTIATLESGDAATERAAAAAGSKLAMAARRFKEIEATRPSKSERN
jgi:rhomboid protease GluP